MNPYETLGIDKDATAQDVRDSYRALSKVHHPDMEGGDQEKFAELQRARDTLLHPHLRAQYDSSGVMPDSEDGRIMQLAVSMLQDNFLALLAQNGLEELERSDLVGSLRKHIKETLQHKIAVHIEDLVKKLDQVGAYEKMLQKRMRKTKKAKHGADIFMLAVKGMTASLHSQLKMSRESMVVIEKALELLDEYKFSYDENRSSGWSFHIGSSSGFSSGYEGGASAKAR